MKRISVLLLCAALSLSLLPGCTAASAARELKAQTVYAVSYDGPPELAEQVDAALSAFGLELLRDTRAAQGENVLLSPLSVALALSMAANGAEGETLAQLEALLSGGSGVDTYDPFHPSVMPTALEAGTLNGHGIAGLKAAVGYIMETGIDKIREKELSLMRCFYEGVSRIPGVKIYGDFDAEERCPVVTLNIGEYDSSEVSDELNVSYGIVTRPGAHCAPLMHRALGTEEQGAVRFSFSHYNTKEEVDSAIKAIKELTE